jgi:hypothetical protein
MTDVKKDQNPKKPEDLKGKPQKKDDKALAEEELVSNNFGLPLTVRARTTSY